VRIAKAGLINKHTAKIQQQSPTLKLQTNINIPFQKHNPPPWPNLMTAALGRPAHRRRTDTYGALTRTGSARHTCDRREVQLTLCRRAPAPSVQLRCSGIRQSWSVDTKYKDHTTAIVGSPRVLSIMGFNARPRYTAAQFQEW